MEFTNILKPIAIGRTTMKNRIVMAPINNSSQMFQADGSMTQRCVDYYVKRAEGGTGLIVTGVFKVENEIERCENIKDGVMKWPLVTRRSIQQYAELASQVHSYGAKIFMQLTAGPGRVTTAEVIRSGVTPVSASANQCHFVPEATCRALETHEVQRIVKAFGDAAELIAMAGIDGVEVHGHEGYLIDQFTTSLWNRRTDKYGGDLGNRLTFPIEILQEIKARLGSSFPVTYRFGARHFVKGPWKSALHLADAELGRDTEEAVAIAVRLEEAGYDGLSVDTGCYESTYWAHPPYFFPRGFALDVTAHIKKAVSIPVMVAGRLGVPALAEKALADGKADMIALARDLMADPFWVQKVAGRDVESIRPCLGCQDGCMYRPGSTGAFLSCSVNPHCGRENASPASQASTPRRILIAGGGVAGMECARMAGLRGHKVTLFERTQELGGHLIEASVPQFKEDIKRLLDWYRKQLNDLKVETTLGTAVTPALVDRLSPDALIIATGSVPVIPSIPGAGRESVSTCCDLLSGRKRAGKNVVVVGGGLEGCETALWLASQGKKVTIVEALSDVATGVFRANRLMLMDLLEDRSVEILTNTTLVEVAEGGIKAVGTDRSTKYFECDTVVLAVGMQADSELYGQMSGKIGRLYAIGDCVKPRRIHDAIWEGWNVGRTV